MSLENQTVVIDDLLRNLNPSNVSVARLRKIAEHLADIDFSELKKLISLQDILQNSSDDGVICTYLKCLSTLLRKSSLRSVEVFHELLGEGTVLDKFLQSVSDTIKLESLSCINIVLDQNSTLMGGEEDAILRWSLMICLRYASYSNYKSKIEVTAIEIVRVAWECLKLISEDHGKILGSFLPSIVDLLKKSLACGSPGLTNASISQCSSSGDLSFNAESLVSKRNFPLVNPNPNNLNSLKAYSSSDESFGYASDQLSDLNDSKFETNYESAENTMKTLQSRIRICAASVFMRLPKVIDSNQLSKYWFVFFPEYCSKSRLSVCKILTRESCFNSRITILKGLKNWIDCNSRMLASAEIPRRPIPFTSLSEKLAQSLLDIHNSMELIIKAEQYPSIVAQCLKCFESLVQVTPYGKVDVSRYFGIFNQYQKYVKDKNLNVKISAIRLYAALISNKLSTSIECADHKTFILSLLVTGISGADNRSIFPNDLCANPSNLRLACLSLLVQIVKHYRQHIQSHMKTLVELARDSIIVKKDSALSPNDRGIVLAGLQLIEAIIDTGPCPGVENLIRLEDFQIFILPEMISQDASLTLFGIELMEKIVGSKILAHDMHSLEKLVENLVFLSKHCHSSSQVLAAILKYLPPIVKQCSGLELNTWQFAFEMMITVLKTSSANIAEKAGCSLIYLTRIFMTIFADLSDSDQSIQFHHMIYNTIAQVTSLVVDESYVQRIKPSCLFSICLYLDALRILKPKLSSRKDEYFLVTKKIFGIANSILPVIILHCQSEIIKVQKTALDCASMVYSIFTCSEDIKQLQFASSLEALTAIIVESIQKPCKKPRNIMLAARALRTIKIELWAEVFQAHLTTALSALISFLDHYEDVSVDVESTVFQQIFFETVRCVIYLVPTCHGSVITALLPTIDSVLIRKKLSLYQQLLTQQTECMIADEKPIILSEYDAFSEVIRRWFEFRP